MSEFENLRREASRMLDTWGPLGKFSIMLRALLAALDGVEGPSCVSGDCTVCAKCLSRLRLSVLDKEAAP